MKNKPIVGANREDITIDITLPVDEDGEYAFDVKGKPIKGKEPVTFSIPRFDFLPRADFKALNERLENLSTDLPLAARNRVGSALWVVGPCRHHPPGGS